MKRRLAAFILVGLWSGTMAGSKDTEYTNMWIAEIDGGEEVAQRVARDLGYTYKSKAEPFENHYVFIREDHPEVSKRNSHHLTTNLLDLDEVKWAEQQAIVQRSKRGIVPEMTVRQYNERATNQETLLNKRQYGYSFSSSDDEKLSDAAVAVTVSASDSIDTIKNNVITKSGSKKVGAFIVCNSAISSSMISQLTSQLIYNGKMDNPVPTASFGSGSGTVKNSQINRMINQLVTLQQLGAGKVAVVFIKGDSGSGTGALQPVNSKPGNSGFGSQGSNSGSDIVYITVSKTDSDSDVTSAVIKGLGNNEIGLLILFRNPLSSTTLNNVLDALHEWSSNGLSVLKLNSGGNFVGNKAIISVVNQYKSMGIVSDGNVAVAIGEGISSAGSGSNLGDQGALAAVNGDNYGPTDSSAGSGSNLGGQSALSAVNGDNSGLTDSSAAFNLAALIGASGEASSNPSETVKPSSGTQASSSSKLNKSSDSKLTNAETSGSIDKVLLVNVDNTDSIVDYIMEQLGDNKKVSALIISGSSTTDSNTIQSIYGKLSLFDKIGGNGAMPVMTVSSENGEPVNTGYIFKTVNNLMAEGKIGNNEVAVVITKGDSVDLKALKEMFEEADQGDLSKLGTFPTQPTDGKQLLSTYKGVTKNIACLSDKRSAYQDMFNDPLWSKQWYAQDYRTTNVPVMDHNVVPVYKMGITGLGVNVAVVDDGVMHNHPDLAANFKVEWSYDMCEGKPGSQPSPKDAKGDNSHGTKCAGEIAMVANNNKCGVGIAYNANIGGIKTLGVRMVDFGEAKGLKYKLDTYDIYSNSWGPNDDGLTLGHVGHMTDESFKDGISKGRDGKGAIYVFSAGNGRESEDNCALDGFINHIVTIPITSASQRGKTVYYSERCTAVFAGTYSGGNAGDEAVATIDINGDCTTTFSGTSAAAPIATGIIALVLQANPNLGYRDVMHLIAMSAEVAPLANNENIWYKNGRGFWVSNDFGFGLMNAENMVLLAKKWTNVGKRQTCVVEVNLENTQTFSVNDDGIVNFYTDACQNKQKYAVFYLEQIELSSTIEYPYRGAISMQITSPAGTTSDILEKRLKDNSPDGFKGWSIKSVHNWGENPKGDWKIVVRANPVPSVSYATGKIHGFTLLFHGTVEMPKHYETPRKYAAFRLPNGETSEFLQMILRRVLELLNMLFGFGHLTDGLV